MCVLTLEGNSGTAEITNLVSVPGMWDMISPLVWGLHCDSTDILRPMTPPGPQTPGPLLPLFPASQSGHHRSQALSPSIKLSYLLTC